jgi:hypothetical protein
MEIAAFRAAEFDARLEREAMEQVADVVAALFDADGPRSRVGLIVASDSAGTATSVQFWGDAMRTGVAFASPELFPWCLANAPCGALARRFGITGPNSTLLGESDALLAALDMAADQIGQGHVDTAIVVALCFANEHQAGKILALRVCTGGGCHPVDLSVLSRLPDSMSLRSATDLLSQALDASRITGTCGAA